MNYILYYLQAVLKPGFTGSDKNITFTFIASFS